MSFMDKILDVLRLNDDDDEYEFANEEYFEEEEYEEPKKKAPRRENKVEVKEKPPVSKITPIAKAQKKQAVSTGMEVCVIKPTTIEDEIEIADTLLSSRTVLINMEGLNIELAQRIIDFSSGSCYAIGGGLQKVSSYIFILTPSNVEISGDIQDLLGGAIPSMRSAY